MNNRKPPVKMNNRDEEMRYMHEHREYLEANHPGQWLALEGDRLYAFGDNSTQVKREAIAKGAVNPVIAVVSVKEYQRSGFKNLINRTVRLVRDIQ